MHYDYLTCGNPNCERKLDLRNEDKNQWITLVVGGDHDYHFCNWEHLKFFVEENEHCMTESLKAYAEMFGKQLRVE